MVWEGTDGAEQELRTISPVCFAFNLSSLAGFVHWKSDIHAPGSQEEAAKHTSESSCWLMIDGNVYDVTNFLDDHPGGGELLLNATAKDATDDFEDVGHSKSARNDMRSYLIGTVDGGRTASKRVETQPRSASSTSKSNDRAIGTGKPATSAGGGGRLTLVVQVLLPVVVVMCAVGSKYLQSSSG
jgi:hypothetical protein